MKILYGICCEVSLERTAVEAFLVGRKLDMEAKSEIRLRRRKPERVSADPHAIPTVTKFGLPRAGRTP
jgi:hypothetical protein